MRSDGFGKMEKQYVLAKATVQELISVSRYHVVGEYCFLCLGVMSCIFLDSTGTEVRYPGEAAE